MHVSAATEIIFMIGTPIAQTRSPALFNARFGQLGIDRAMVPIDLPSEGLPSFLSAVRTMNNCAGFVATLPHKRDLLGLVDRASIRAVGLGAVNVVRRNGDGRLDGDMADGAGFWNGVAKQGIVPRGLSLALAGAGAAATAIADEFARRGGRLVSLHAVDRKEREVLVGHLKALGVEVVDHLPRDAHEIDVVVNATPVGMALTPGLSFPADLLAQLPAHALIADAITKPLDTPLLATAKARGLRTVDGNAMTEGQFKILHDFVFGMAADG